MRNTDSKAVVDLRRFDAPVELQALALKLPPPEGALLPLSLAVAADGMLPLFIIYLSTSGVYCFTSGVRFDSGASM